MGAHFRDTRFWLSVLIDYAYFQYFLTIIFSLLLGRFVILYILLSLQSFIGFLYGLSVFLYIIQLNRLDIGL